MKKTKFTKIKQSLLKKTPIMGFTVMQLLILFVVINGGTAALVLSQRKTPVTQDTNTTIPTTESNIQEPTPIVNVTPQDTTPSSSNNQAQTRNTQSSSNDEWLKAHDAQRKVEEAKRVESERCNTANSNASSKYSAAIDRAKAAYDTVMAEWNQVKDLPYYQRHPYEQYATDAKTKHNAISRPAYQEYVSTVNALKAQGCQVIQSQTDYSWAGY
jgi:hypothetical protein